MDAYRWVNSSYELFPVLFCGFSFALFLCFWWGFLAIDDCVNECRRSPLFYQCKQLSVAKQTVCVFVVSSSNPWTGSVASERWVNHVHAGTDRENSERCAGNNWLHWLTINTLHCCTRVPWLGAFFSNRRMDISLANCEGHVQGISPASGCIFIIKLKVVGIGPLWWENFDFLLSILNHYVIQLQAFFVWLRWGLGLPLVSFVVLSTTMQFFSRRSPYYPIYWPLDWPWIMDRLIHQLRDFNLLLKSDVFVLRKGSCGKIFQKIAEGTLYPSCFWWGGR